MKSRLKVTFNSPVVLGFACICLAATIAGMITNGASTRLLFSTYRTSVFSPTGYLRLFTHVFGHSSWGHLMGNMAYILLLGPMLEEKYGSGRLSAVMAVTALVTGVINNLLFGHLSLCGASGIVFAFILMTSFTSFREGEIPLTFILVAVIYLGEQIIDGITVKDNISNLSHILGGMVGAAAGYFLNKKRRTDR